MLKKVVIENFRCFEGRFELSLNPSINILVGDNEAGKSTILEAIHLALSGLINGRYAKNELTQYLFNNKVVEMYLDSLKSPRPLEPPEVVIEVHFDEDGPPLFLGDGDGDTEKSCGLCCRIHFDEQYADEYAELVKTGDVRTLPIEYYDISWTTFARKDISPRSVLFKSALINSSRNRYDNGSDVYISRIIRESLETEELVQISQAYRRIRDLFMDEEAIEHINNKIRQGASISEKEVKLGVELLPRNAWENSLVTYLDEVPFQYVGQGEQCIVKTQLALTNQRARRASIILLEEPENHLTHSRLNKLLTLIKSKCDDRQLLISTHSSFVANKLDLGNLILLENQHTTRISDLSEDTRRFFEKISGYDTLRMILCKKAILVEGPSDELIVQKAYMMQNNGHLPIEDGVEVISVGTSFSRFLEIAEKLEKTVAVVTDNDGDVEALRRKYAKYLGANQKKYIRICFDETVDSDPLKRGQSDYNYDTLEPKLLKRNSLNSFNAIFGTTYDTEDELLKYMKNNKTECALKIFETKQLVEFPEYIVEAIKFNGQ